MSAIWWFEEGVKLVTPIATVVVAVYVGNISKRSADTAQDISRRQTAVAEQQARTAQEKLRLDLYDRRFDVYRNAMVFHAAITKWRNTGDRTKDYKTESNLLMPLLEALRESYFLFPTASGIQNHLLMLQATSTIVIDLKQRIGRNFTDELDPVAPDTYESAMKFMLDSPEKLRQLFAPYLNFHEVKIAESPTLK